MKLALALLAMLPAAAQTGPIALKSPNGALEMSVATQGGQLGYSVAFHGRPVIEWSNLGLALEGAPPLGPAARIESAQTSNQDETWNSVQGKASPIRNHYNAVAVAASDGGRRLTVEARAYDDGVAFRYVVPEQPALKQLRILNEATQFHFTKDATTYSMISRGFETSNEDNYHELTIGGLHPEYLVNLPVLIEVPGVAWVGLTEADLADYSSLYVTGAGNQTLAARLAVREEDPKSNTDIAPSFDPKADAAKVSVIATTPVRSSWRALMIADNPGRLVESNMVVNLNPPSAIADTSWIKPGKAAWAYGFSRAKGVANPGMNNETMKYYIDFAARNGFEFMLIDGGWQATRPGETASGQLGGFSDTETIPAIDIPMLVAYAKSKNVRLWLITSSKDMRGDELDIAFAQFEKWGIVGAKIDFIDRTDQWMMNWYREVARKAAAHHVMIDFHGATKPDGSARTYPNVLTREGVMGEEYNEWSARVTPRHDVTLAFVRNLAGPMDYTPGRFNNVTREEFVPSGTNPMAMHTRAHATALFVVLESELEMLSDPPEAYDGQKELDFLKAVPTSWDETRVVNGVPARYITIARRRGKDWFVGSITNEDAREVDLPLSFLGSGSYDAEIYADGPKAATEPKDSTLEKRRVNAQTVLKLKLAPAGGAAIRLVPAR